MSRHQAESPWQLHMDFSRRSPEPPSSEYPIQSGLFTNFEQRPDSLGRFVRRVQENITARTPTDVAQYFIQHIYTPWEDFTQEEIYTLMLDNLNRPTHAAMIYRGTVNSVHIRTAELFRPAILHNASRIIMAHNHPSNSVEPSLEDIRTSSLVAEAGRLLDVELLDSLIIGKESFASLRERNLLCA